VGGKRESITHKHNLPPPTATYRHTPPPTATHRHTPPHTATHRHTPPHTATHHTPPLIAIRRHSPPFTAIHRHSPPFTATHCHTTAHHLQHHRLKHTFCRSTFIISTACSMISRPFAALFLNLSKHILSIEPLIPNGKAVNFPNWLKLVHKGFSLCGVYVQTSSTLIMSENETLLAEST
jgi:hypothetical protein